MWSGLQQTRTPGMRFPLYALPRHEAQFSPSSSRHMLSPPLPARRSTRTLTHTCPSYRRLATFARIQEKNHSVVHSPHAKSASPVQTNSPATPGYTAMIIAQPPLVGPAQKARCLCQMVGMRRTLLFPKELLKRRPGAEQTVMTRCVLCRALLTLPNTLHLTRRNPMPVQYIILQGVPVHPFHCQPMHPPLPSPLCRA